MMRLTFLLASLALAAGCAEPSAQRNVSPTAAARGAAAPRASETGTRVRVAGREATVWASSELASSDGRYGAARAFDGDPATAWVEGVAGYGAPAGELAFRDPAETTGQGQEALYLRFDTPAVIDGVALQAGFLKSGRLYERNGVPDQVEIAVDGEPLGTYTLSHSMALVFEGVSEHGRPDARPDGCYHAATGSYDAPRVVVFESSVRGREVSVRLVRAGRGSAHEDTAISELSPILAETDGLIGAVRDALRRPSASLAAADVQDLSALSVSPYAVRHQRLPRSSSPTDVGPPRPRIRSGREGLPAIQTFVTADWPHLAGSAVLVEPSGSGAVVTGTVSDAEGDGEWVELRPQLVLSADGRVAAAREVATFGAAPGCRGDVSRLQATPTGPEPPAPR